MVGAGEGGDETTAIDAAAERVILERFRGEDVRLVSEEAGLSGDGRWTVVVDPIDGSLNAKRGIPFFSLSIAVADGGTMDDVVFGYVHDFGSGEEWTATRGGGALLERTADRRAPEGRARDPVVRGDHDRVRLGERCALRRHRAPVAGDGLARDLALPPGGGPGRRRRLAEAGALRRHRGRAAARPRAGPCDRAARSSRRSVRLRSISSAARESPPQATPSSVQRLCQALTAPSLRST